MAAIIILGGCQRYYHDTPVDAGVWKWQEEYREQRPEGRFKTSMIIDQVDQYYRGSSNGPLGVTTLVNLNDLYGTSAFGRMYAEQLMSELVMRGFDVVELRHADALSFLSRAGEFALSRDVGAVRPHVDLTGVIVGTYVESPVRMYVNVRLVDPATAVVLSAGTVEMIKTKEIARLSRGRSPVPPTLERIPVKHLGRRQFPLAWTGQHPWDAEESWTVPYPNANGMVTNMHGEGKHDGMKKEKGKTKVKPMLSDK